MSVSDEVIHPVGAEARRFFARTEVEHPPLSILFVIPSYPPVLGGAEMHASRLAAALAARGHHVEVITTWAPPMPNAGRWRDPAGIPVRGVGRALPDTLRPRAFVLRAAVALLHSRHRFDVVQIFLPGLHVVTALAASAVARIPCAVMFGGAQEIPALRRSRLGRLQLSTIRRFARRVVVLNTPMRDDVRGFGVEDTRIASHPCSVDPETFAPGTPERVIALRARHAIAPRAPVVLFTGRFVTEKALETLIEAFALVRGTLHDAVLVLAGDGPLREPLEDLARRTLDAGAVRFPGRLPPDEVADYLQAADAFAFISSSEGIPCSVIEAMSCALPCVVSDAPGVAQLIDHDIHGLVVPIGDASATAHALVRVLSDRILASKLGTAARARAIEAFSSDVVAANHERMYRAMVQASALEAAASRR